VNFCTELKAGIEALTTYIVDTLISFGGGMGLWLKDAMDIAPLIHKNEVMNEIPLIGFTCNGSPYYYSMSDSTGIRRMI
jgi:hypothetical protein